MQLNGTMENEIKTLHCLFIVYLQSHNLCAVALANGNCILIKTTPTRCCESQQFAVCQEVKEWDCVRYRKSVVVVQRSCGLTNEEHAGTRSHTHTHTLAALSPFTSVMWSNGRHQCKSIFSKCLQDASTYAKMLLSCVALLALHCYLLLKIFNGNSMFFETCLFLCTCRICRLEGPC